MEPREAEVACESYWLAQGALQTRRPVRTKWQKVDFLGADVLAVMEDGSKTWSQVTTAQRANNIRVRRRKLETVPWAPTDRVFVFEVEERRNVPNPRRMDRFFRVHEYHHPGTADVYYCRLHPELLGTWSIWPDPVPISKAMTRARRETREPG